jgi:hypothetical protein
VTALILHVVFLWVSDIVADIVERTTLRAFENRVLRRIFGPTKDEII